MATDDFNRADAANLGANWTDVQQQGGTPHTFAIVSNRCSNTGSASGDVCARYSATTFANDQYSQVKIATTHSATFVQFGPSVRCSNSAATYYGFRCRTDAGARAIVKVVAGGAATTLASDSGTTSLNDLLRLEISGNTLTAKVNGVQVLQVTDSSSPLTSGWAGLCGRNPDTGNAMDDWEGGDLAGGGSTPGTSWQQQGAMGVMVAM